MNNNNVISNLQVSGCAASVCGTELGSGAEQLNRACFCKTLDRDKLNSILSTDVLNQDFLIAHPQLFSNTAVFISPAQLTQIQEVIDALERVIHLPSYQQKILMAATTTEQFDAGVAGVFMGYDFHLSLSGPKLIEINTNAGGAFLNAALMTAQTNCCRAGDTLVPPLFSKIDEQFIAMFINEWRYTNTGNALSCIAIVDENPSAQFLYPEFKMAQRLFECHGIKTLILDPSELEFTHNQLHHGHQKIDLVYNRLTDFLLMKKNCSSLKAAYLSSSVVVTPNPRHYALYANKRNLAWLSDISTLTALDVNAADRHILQTAIPPTQIVTAENAEFLWNVRKQLFFKPTTGFGSRAAYRGDKLTKRVWDEILRGDYVAQTQVPPSERGIQVDGKEVMLKMDIRAYTYKGQIQLLAARLYQGQTTNFRTQGGGFAPVFMAA